MRKIKVKADNPLFNNVEVKIFDVTEEKIKQRATFQIEYAKVDVESFLEQGLSLEETMEKYKERFFFILGYYLSGDFEIVEGLEEVLDIVKTHITPYFKA